MNARRLLAASTLLSTVVAAGPASAAADPRLLDDPGGYRTLLEEAGVVSDLFYNQFLSWKPRGGADHGSRTGTNGSYDWLTRVDGDRLFGWPGLDALLHARGLYDRGINRDVGALSDPIDDADFNEEIYVSQLWAQQSLFDGRIRLRLGYLESSAIYDRNAYANSEDRQFMTTFLDNDGLLPLPTGLGGVLFLRPLQRWEVAVGFIDGDNFSQRAGFDTVFDDVESVTFYLESTFGWQLDAEAPTRPGALRLGVFLDGAKRTVFGRTDPVSGRPKTERGHGGAYLSFDQKLWVRASGESGIGRSLGFFARLGYADEDVSRIAWFWSVGFECVGALPARPADVLGLGGYHAIGSDRYNDSVPGDFEGEGAIELYYAIAATDWLVVTPDFQYVIDPGGFTDAQDAIVLNLRLRVSF